MFLLDDNDDGIVLTERVSGSIGGMNSRKSSVMTILGNTRVTGTKTLERLVGYIRGNDSNVKGFTISDRDFDDDVKGMNHLIIEDTAIIYLKVLNLPTDLVSIAVRFNIPVNSIGHSPKGLYIRYLSNPNGGGNAERDIRSVMDTLNIQEC